MPGSYYLSSITANGQQRLTARGQSLTETFAAALTGLLAAAGALLDQAADTTTEIAAPIRGEGTSPAALFADLAADLSTRLELDGGRFTAVELDGVIKTDDGLSAWGYLHGQVTSAQSPISLRLLEEPVIETDDRRDVIGVSLQLRVVPAKDLASS